MCDTGCGYYRPEDFAHDGRSYNLSQLTSLGVCLLWPLPARPLGWEHGPQFFFQRGLNLRFGHRERRRVEESKLRCRFTQSLFGCPLIEVRASDLRSQCRYQARPIGRDHPAQAPLVQGTFAVKEK